MTTRDLSSCSFGQPRPFPAARREEPIPREVEPLLEIAVDALTKDSGSIRAVDDGAALRPGIYRARARRTQTVPNREVLA